MVEKIYKLVARMIVAGMAKQYKAVCELYEKYLRERHLYVSIKEIMETKGGMRVGINTRSFPELQKIQHTKSAAYNSGYSLQRR